MVFKWIWESQEENYIKKKKKKSKPPGGLTQSKEALLIFSNSIIVVLFTSMWVTCMWVPFKQPSYMTTSPRLNTLSSSLPEIQIDIYPQF